MQARIVRADPSAFEAIAGLLTRVYIGGGYLTDAPAFRSQDVAEWAGRATVLVALDDEAGRPSGELNGGNAAGASRRPVGVVGLATAGAGGARIATAREVEIQRLGVSPDHRRRGIGRQLMLACLRLASGAQGCRVVLWTRPAMTEAQRLYTSLGFRRNPARDLVDRVSRRLVYELDLTSSTSPPG